MLKKVAFIYGIVFVLIGILGFVPGITTTGDDGMKLLLGLFMVSGPHNLVHLLSGLAALGASRTERLSRFYFQAFGVVYALVTVIGFIIGPGHQVLGFIPVNTADNFLHLLISLSSLYFGFGVPKSKSAPTATV